MAEPNFKSWYPVFGIRSYDEAIDYYVDGLGFELDWEWRAAPGEPAIVSISREGITIGLNESLIAATGSWLSVAVADVHALAEEWNGRRPGSVEVVGGVPYEGFVIHLVDPFGNRIDLQQLLSEKESDARREEQLPRMRHFIRQQIADGKPMPSPDEVVAGVGPSLGFAVEVLNEFPEYGEAFRLRREQAWRDLQVERVSLAPQPVLVIERESALADLAAHVADALPQVYGHLSARGTAPAGPPFMRFIDLAQRFDVAIGFPGGRDVEPDGEIELCELPGGDAVTALYTGRPGGLAEAWATLIDFAASLDGCRDDGRWGGIGGWQVYLDDPEVVGSDNACTRLYLPLVR